MHFSRLISNNRIAFTSSASAARQASILLTSFVGGVILSTAAVVLYSHGTRAPDLAVPEIASEAPALVSDEPLLPPEPAQLAPIVPPVDVAPPAESAPKASEQPPSVMKESTYTLRSGDTLTRIWKTLGADPNGGILAAKAFKSAGIATSSLRAGDKISVTQDASGDIVRFVRRFRDGRVLTLTGSTNEGYKASVTEAKLTEKERQLSGMITHSFALAAADARVPGAVADELVDLFSGRVEFRRELHPGDTFSVIYGERSFEDGESLDPGPIVAASIQRGDRLFVAVRHVGKDGKARYFDEKGGVLGNYFLRYPLKYSRISSVFAGSRFHPVLGVRRPHNGVDFAAPIGTPVRAVADGVIVSAGYRRQAGNMIVVRHSERYSTAYLHLSKIGVGLRPGSRVSRGDTIGAVGMTGLATGPHLHFSLYDRGAYVDPLKADLPSLAPQSDPIPAAYLQAKLDLIRRSHQMLAMAPVAPRA